MLQVNIYLNFHKCLTFNDQLFDTVSLAKLPKVHKNSLYKGKLQIFSYQTLLMKTRQSLIPNEDITLFCPI